MPIGVIVGLQFRFYFAKHPHALNIKAAAVILVKIVFIRVVKPVAYKRHGVQTAGKIIFKGVNVVLIRLFVGGHRIRVFACGGIFFFAVGTGLYSRKAAVVIKRAVYLDNAGNFKRFFIVVT